MSYRFGPTVVRRRLGTELKRLRELSGARLDEVARQLECSPSKISRLEGGQGIPKVRDVRDLIDVYGLADEPHRDRILRWASEGKAQGWWHPFSDAAPSNLDYYMSLEAEATTIQSYTTPYLHGLLQTADYARTVLTGAIQGATTADIDRLVELRLRRQEILHDSDPVRLVVVIDEAVVRRTLGRPAVVRAQIDALLGLMELPQVELYVLPFTAEADEAMGTFTLFFPREEHDHPVVNVESTKYDHYFEQDAQVLQFVGIFEDLRSKALDAEGTRRLLAQRRDELADQTG